MLSSNLIRLKTCATMGIPKSRVPRKATAVKMPFAMTSKPKPRTWAQKQRKWTFDGLRTLKAPLAAWRAEVVLSKLSLDATCVSGRYESGFPCHEPEGPPIWDNPSDHVETFCGQMSISIAEWQAGMCDKVHRAILRCQERSRGHKPQF